MIHGNYKKKKRKKQHERRLDRHCRDKVGKLYRRVIEILLLKRYGSSSLKGEVAATDVQTAGTKTTGKESNRISVTRGLKGNKEARKKKSDKEDVTNESNKGNADQEYVLSIPL